MLLPELPAYLASMGGEEYIGLIIALFTLTAGISRPFSGKLTDSIGRKPVMFIGAIVCVICGFLYPLLGTVYGFLLLRLVHGFSTGFSPTALSTYVSDIIPHEKLGEAMGIHGLSFSLGMALGPAIGSWITLLSSYTVLFYCSSFMAFLSILLIFNIKETLTTKEPFKPSMLKIKLTDIFDSNVLYPAIFTFLSFLSFGSILTLIPDWSVHLGIEYKGLFFVIYTISSITIRFLAGKSSDKYGRIPIIIIGFLFLTIAMILLASMTTYWGFVFSSIIFGLSVGILSPTLNAWTIDLSDRDKKGKALSTMYISLEAGIGLSALLAGWFYQSSIQNIPLVFYTCAFFAFVSFLFLLIKKIQT